jgi:hypothetical protein
LRRRRNTGLRLRGACGQPESGHRDAAREQRPGNDPLQGGGGVHAVLPLLSSPALTSLRQVPKGRINTDPKNTRGRPSTCIDAAMIRYGGNICPYLEIALGFPVTMLAAVNELGARSDSAE